MTTDDAASSAAAPPPTPVLATVKYMALSGHTTGVKTCCFCPVTRRIASCTKDGQLRLWDSVNGGCITAISNTHTDSIQCSVFSLNGARLATGSNDGTVRLWDGVTGKSIATLSGHANWVVCAAFSANSQLLVSGSYDQTLRIWNSVTGKFIASLEGHTGYVFCCAFSPTGSVVLSGGNDNDLRLWDVLTGRCLAVLTGHTRFVSSCGFSPDGSKMISGSADKTVKVWDTAKKKLLATLQGHTGAVHTCMFSPCDSSFVLSSSRDNTLRIWNTSSATGAATPSVMSQKQSPITCCCWSATGSRVISGSDDKMVRIWDLSGKLVKTLGGHSDSVTCLAALDSSRILSGSNDTTLRIWDPETDYEDFFMKMAKAMAASTLSISTPSSSSSSTATTVPKNGLGMEFGVLVERPECRELKQMVHGYLKGFEKATGGDAMKEEVETKRIFSELEKAMQSYGPWAYLPEIAFEQAKKEMHRYLFIKLHPIMFAKKKDSQLKDSLIYSHLQKLRNVVTPEYLSLQKEHHDESIEAAIGELEKIDDFLTPIDKMLCVFNCCKILFYVLATTPNRKAPPGADEFLPLFIYTILHCNLKHLNSNVEYISRFVEVDETLQEAYCFFTHLVAASNHLASLTPDAVKEEILRKAAESKSPKPSTTPPVAAVAPPVVPEIVDLPEPPRSSAPLPPKQQPHPTMNERKRQLRAEMEGVEKQVSDLEVELSKLVQMEKFEEAEKVRETVSVKKDEKLELEMELMELLVSKTLQGTPPVETTVTTPTPATTNSPTVSVIQQQQNEMEAKLSSLHAEADHLRSLLDSKMQEIQTMQQSLQQLKQQTVEQAPSTTATVQQQQPTKRELAMKLQEQRPTLSMARAAQAETRRQLMSVMTEVAQSGGAEEDVKQLKEKINGCVTAIKVMEEMKKTSAAASDFQKAAAVTQDIREKNRERDKYENRVKELEDTQLNPLKAKQTKLSAQLTTETQAFQSLALTAHTLLLQLLAFDDHDEPTQPTQKQ